MIMDRPMSDMSDVSDLSDLVTPDDIVRARTDPVFRQRLYADILDRLLDALNKLRRSGDSDPTQSRLIREGVDLAVKLADRLQKPDNSPGPKAA